MKKESGAYRKLTTEKEEKLIYVITNSTPDKVGFESRKTKL
jgi:hypothetical protein